MQVLLIDNHDSFTHNVAHDIALVTGRLPDVVLNDDPPVPASALTRWLGRYDAIVVSPGPGTPECPADLAMSQVAIAQGEVPLLGICLGMQAIARDAGVPIIRAPRAVHGEVAEVRHDGGGLFTGLASPLAMVRYHSLIVDRGACESCDDLVVDAYDGDGIMALHRRSRPQWGVQAHPESICSEHGRDLLARFFDLARDWNRRQGRPGAVHPRSVTTTVPAVKTGSDPTWHVLVQRVHTTATTEAIFDAVFRGQHHAWWLDTAIGDGVSICGSAAGPLAKVAVAAPGGVRVRDVTGHRESAQGLLDLVERTSGSVQVADVEGGALDATQLPFVPGWVGYVGYEHACQWLDPHRDGAGQEPASRSEDAAPPAVLVFGDRVVAVDGASAWVMALTDGPVDAQQRTWIARTAEQLRTLGTPSSVLPNPPSRAEVSVRHDRAAYLRLIERCQAEIAAGESYELCLTNRILVAVRSDPWCLYRRLRHLSPCPFAAYLGFGDHHVLSASPERFLRVDPNGQVEAKPIKGTRPRAEDPADDARLAGELLESVKERAENLMIVDLLRNDLSRVCTPGTVHVPSLFNVESHASVHQLVSTIRGKLAPANRSLDAVRAALPGGSMTGAPKERSVSILRGLEAGPRGVYSGVVGYFSLNGAIDLSIVIRTIVHHADHLEFGMGGAITTRSDGVEEWQETLVKARTLGVALGIDLAAQLDRSPGSQGLDGAAPTSGTSGQRDGPVRP